MPATLNPIKANILTSGDVVIVNSDLYTSLNVEVSGTYTGANFAFEVAPAPEGPWAPVQATRVDSGAGESVSGVIASTTRFWSVPVAAHKFFRLRNTALASGTVAVLIQPSMSQAIPVAGAASGGGGGAVTQSGVWTVGLNTAIPAGANTIGNVGVVGTVPVSGTFWQATQPVSLTTLPALTAGSAIVGKFGIDQTTPGTTNAVAASQVGVWTVTGAKASAQSANIVNASTTVGPWTVPTTGSVTIVMSGTYNGVNAGFWASSDGGTTYYPVQGTRSDTGVVEATTGVLTNTIRSWDFLVGGATHFKVVSTAWVSGTAAIQFNPHAFAVDPSPATIPQGAAPAGSTILGNPVPFAGVDSGSLIRTLKTDTNGNAQVRVTDNTNFMPTMDVAARAGFFQVTNGTSTATVKAASTAAAAADTALVVSFAGANSATKIGDGTNNAAVKAASTAAVAADPALVVALSPNNNTLANALITKVSDGTNTAAVKAASTAAVATDPAIVVALSPNNNTQALAQFAKVTDGTTTAKVQPASTTPVAADPALTVALSPNLLTTTGYSVLAAATTNAANIKASAAKLLTVNITNYSAGIRYIRFFNKATAPTPGTDLPYITIPVAAGANYAAEWGTFGLPFNTGLGIDITTGVAENDATATAAGDVRVLASYL